MKIRKTTSIVLILIVLVSAAGTGGFSYGGQKNSFKIPHGTELRADSQNESHDFRETIKIALSTETRDDSIQFEFDLNRISLSLLPDVRYFSYLCKQLGQSPRARLFIDFCSLLI